MAKKKNKISKKKAAQAQAIKKAQLQRAIAFIAVAITFAIVAFLSLSNSATPPAAVSNGLPADITTAMGYQKVEEGAFLLDVRTQEEWEEYHIDGATMIVLDQLESRVSEVPFDQEVIIICNSGNRSVVARDILLASGHPSVTSISAGIQGWMKAGYDVVSGK